MLRTAAGLQGAGGSTSCPEAKHEHSSQGPDWQNLWTQEVWLVSKDHTLSQLLNPLRAKSTKRAGYQSLSLFRAFSSSWYKQSMQMPALYKQC